MIRKAMIGDVKAIHSLLQHYSNKGELLARPLPLYTEVRIPFAPLKETKGKTFEKTVAVSIYSLVPYAQHIL